MLAKDLGELIGWLKANPNMASIGVPGMGARLLAAFFQRETKTQFTLVPYRGTAPTMQDLIAGQIDLSFNPPDQLPLMRAGSIKAYAVTGNSRMALAPDIPTFRELGLPSISFSEWFGLFVPMGTSRDVIAKLNAAAGGPGRSDNTIAVGRTRAGDIPAPRTNAGSPRRIAKGRCREMVANYEGVRDQSGLDPTSVHSKNRVASG